MSADPIGKARLEKEVERAFRGHLAEICQKCRYSYLEKEVERAIREPPWS